jgi:hypothetical protein
MAHPFTQQLNQELTQALQEFGTYSFDDKGPEEVMDLSGLTQIFRQLSTAEKVQVAQEIYHNFRANSVLIVLLNNIHLSDSDLQTVLNNAHPDLQDWFS